MAGTRWRIEENIQAGKGCAGLDEHQVRTWTSWHRWTTLAMLAHAFLAVTAARQRAAHGDHSTPPTDMETDRDRGDYFDPSAGKVRLDEVWPRWMGSRTIDPATEIQYESRWRLHVEPVFGGGWSRAFCRQRSRSGWLICSAPTGLRRRGARFWY
ncbi:hypothetical protein GCM10010522_29970 [Kribbella solani]